MTQRIEEEEEALKPQEIRSRDIRHIKMNIPGREIVRQRAFQLLSFMVFWGQIQNYMMRLNLGLLIVAMVKRTEFDDNQTGNYTDTPCGKGENQVGANETDYNGEFEWNEFQIGLILSSFSWGYIATQMIGGRLAETFGTRKIYGFSMFSCGLLSFISPWVVKWDYKE